MTHALDRLLDLLFEAGRTVERVELAAADIRELIAEGSSLHTFRYDGALYHRGVIVEAGDRSRVIAHGRRGELLAFPLPEKVAL